MIRWKGAPTGDVAVADPLEGGDKRGTIHTLCRGAIITLRTLHGSRDLPIQDTAVPLPERSPCWLLHYAPAWHVARNDFVTENVRPPQRAPFRLRPGYAI
jgi:hypothetical protein